ncbi:MAG: hypothetical protein IJ157_00210 [Clostridia bacterium]|nr:hypothetical protein [Clostridia bacterium]
MGIQKMAASKPDRRRFWCISFILTYVAAHALAYAPLGLPLVFPTAISIPFPLQIALCFIVFVFLIYPLRFFIGAKLCSLSGEGRAAGYLQLVIGGLLRMGAGFIWGIPFAAGIYKIYLYVFVYDASQASAKLAEIGDFLQSALPSVNQHTLGIAAVMIFLLCSLLLFMYGWHRGTCYDFLLKKDETSFSAFRIAQRIRKKAKRPLLFNSMISFLLFLLPCISFCAVLSWRHGGLSQALMAMELLFSAGLVLDQNALILAAGAFLLFYLPLLPFRKARNADVVMKYDDKKG